VPRDPIVLVRDVTQQTCDEVEDPELSRAFRGGQHLALAIGGALLVASGCAHREGLGRIGKVEPPVVSLSNLAPVEASLFEARVRVDLRLQNPNDFAVTCDGMRFDLELNEQPFLRGVSDERISLPRLGEQVVSVEGTTTTLDLWRQLRGLAADPGAGIAYRLEGRLFLVEPWRTGVDFERSGGVGGSVSTP